MIIRQRLSHSHNDKITNQPLSSLRISSSSSICYKVTVLGLRLFRSLFFKVRSSMFDVQCSIFLRIMVPISVFSLLLPSPFSPLSSPLFPPFHRHYLLHNLFHPQISFPPFQSTRAKFAT